MNRAMAFCQSLVGKKLIMAVTGVILVLFVIGHLLGNLQIFLGPARLNAYSAFLKSTGELLWAARIILLAALILHILASIQVSLADWRARPNSYVVRKDVETGYAARTMILGGPLIFLYVIYHLMMFTFLTTGPGYSQTDVYRNLVLAFQVPAISGVYIVAMLILGMHLYHGAWSMLQSLGITFPTRPGLRRLLRVIAVLISVGYISIPAAVLTGLIG